MNPSNQTSNDKLFMAKALEATIHIGLVVLLLYWCFKIGQPFIEIVIWGIIGLFVGAIILAFGYKLFLAWLNEDTQPKRASSKSE